MQQQALLIYLWRHPEASGPIIGLETRVYHLSASMNQEHNPSKRAARPRGRPRKGPDEGQSKDVRILGLSIIHF